MLYMRYLYLVFYCTKALEGKSTGVLAAMSCDALPKDLPEWLAVGVADVYSN